MTLSVMEFIKTKLIKTLLKMDGGTGVCQFIFWMYDTFNHRNLKIIFNDLYMQSTPYYILKTLKILQKKKTKPVRTQEFRKVAGYKLNIQNCHNELSERETKKMIPFTVASNRVKYLGINSTEEVKDLHTESYKILIKDTEEDTNKWKDILGTWTGRINS